jgi:uncharacterized protein (DUF1778 family)
MMERQAARLDRRFFVLDEEAWDKFMAALDAPPKDNLRLRKLLARKPIWGRRQPRRPVRRPD